MCIAEKFKINVEEHQKDLYDLESIQPLEEEMTFYYDEIGNGREFSLGSQGFNDPDAGDFILGGVAHEGQSLFVDVNELHKDLNYNKTQKEMKFRHLFSKSKDFISFMNSYKANKFLEWLSKSGLYIHYTVLNRFYFSIVDIVDSLWEAPNDVYFEYSSDIKTEFYDFAINHRVEVTQLLIKHRYPYVKEASIFCRELRSLIESYSSGYILQLFCKMLKYYENINSMDFIQGKERKNINHPDRLIIIPGYYIFYLLRCEEFSKSWHVFDEELRVIKMMNNFQLYENGKMLNNWKFVNSCDNVFVQISDLVVGLLRNLFLFLDNTSLDDIRKLCLHLTDSQVKNFSTIYNLICRSDHKHCLLFKNVIPPTFAKKRMFKLMILSGMQLVTIHY